MTRAAAPGAVAPDAVASDDLALRPATTADLATCEAIWRDALNDYLVPMGQPAIPADNPGLRQLHAHLLATDPSSFWIAEAVADRRPIGFAAAVRRDAVWYLSMLFVRPGLQLGGIGRALLDRVLPGPGERVVLAVATDAAQPISNGLYATRGMPPRLPMFSVIGRPTRPDALEPLPPGISATRLEDLPATARARAEVEIEALDAGVIGLRHPADHAYIRGQGRVGFAFRDRDGRLRGYGYTSEVGRLGPVAVAERELLAPVVGHLLGAVEPRGASAVWVTGDSGPTLAGLVRAGLRIEGLPVLLGWSEPFADFGRYVPISPGLL